MAVIVNWNGVDVPEEHEAIARAWESVQAGEGRPAADVLRDLGKG